MKYALPVFLMLALHIVLLRIDAYSVPHVLHSAHLGDDISVISQDPIVFQVAER